MTGTATRDRSAETAARPPRRPAKTTRKAGKGPGRFTAWLGTPQAELLLVLALVALAVAVRWPHLLRFPRFTDETDEVRWALAIARGEMLPLVPKDTYFGPLHHYIVATCLWLFGPSIPLPRLIVMVIGALTVGATYLLGREVGGRPVGALAAALLVTAPQHIVVNSHVAWQSSTTPLYSTLSLWMLVRGLRTIDPGRGSWGRGGRWLVGSGFLFGLALQTHAATIMLAPALAGTVLFTLHARGAWRLMRRPWPYAAFAASLVGYSPVLLYNLIHGLPGLTRVTQSRNYVYETNPSWGTYRHNLANLGLELLRIISNPIRVPERRFDYLTSPYLLIMAGLCLAGIALLLRRRQPLPFLAVLCTAALMPRFSKAYGVEGDYHMLSGRYVTYLLPLAEVAIATAALALAGLALARVPRLWRRLPARELAAIAPALLLGALVLYPLLPLARYYAHEEATNPDNATTLKTVELVKAARGPRTPVLVDTYFDRVVFKEGVEALDVITWLLLMDGVPHQRVDDPAGAIAALAATVDPSDAEALPVVVMMRDRCFRVPETVPLQRISERLRLTQLYRDHPSYYAIYRYAPPPQQAGCFEATGPQPGD